MLLMLARIKSLDHFLSGKESSELATKLISYRFFFSFAMSRT